MNIKKIIFVISLVLILQPITGTQFISETSAQQTLEFHSFEENDFLLPDNWHDPEEAWEPTTDSINGKTSMRLTYDVDGLVFNALNYEQSFSNVSISATFDIRGTNQHPAHYGLWVHAGEPLSGTAENKNYTSFADGYVLLISGDIIRLQKVGSNGEKTTLSQISNPFGSASDYVYNLRLVAYNGILTGYISTKNSQTEAIITYDTTNDADAFQNGNVAVFGRNNIEGLTTVVDDISIHEIVLIDDFDEYYSFETSNSLQDPENAWKTSNLYPTDGQSSLSLNYDSTNGLVYNAIRSTLDYSDSETTAWFKSSGSTAYRNIYGLWVRSGPVLNGTPVEQNYKSFGQGYGFALTSDIVRITRVGNDGTTTILTETNNPFGGIENNHFRLKFIANGDILKGYISTTGTFSSTPILSYDISTDSVKYYTGKTAFFGRNNVDFTETYVDEFTISDNMANYTWNEVVSMQFESLRSTSFPGWEDPERHWRISTSGAIDGARSAMLGYNSSNGLVYNSMRTSHSYQSVSVTGWFQSSGSTAYRNIYGLWVRSGPVLNGTPVEQNYKSFGQGYGFALTSDIVRITRVGNDGTTTILTETNNPFGSIENNQFHLKFIAYETILAGYISTGETFSDIPNLVYDISDDETQFLEGRTGFFGRNNVANVETYVDAVSIQEQIELPSFVNLGDINTSDKTDVSGENTGLSSPELQLSILPLSSIISIILMVVLPRKRT